MTAVPATLRLRREGTLRSRAARGDSVAFAAVYERYHQALYRYCRSILRHEEDAQDALQSTMAKAFAALQDESRDFDLKPWLFRIAHNEAISILRRRRETTELGDVVDHAPMEDRILEREELRALQLDLADLPERQRAALVLRELNGLSHVEIGAVLDLEPTAVKHTIFEARSALFTCREGREMDCHDVRRMLSDGDGRVLRGRGVRAHLRTCSDCRRFRDDLAQRPVALRMLAPPLPTAAAASLLAQLIGGGTAAKLLACVAVAGGGATLAVEVQQARQAPRAVAAEARPTRTPAPRRPQSTPAPIVVAAKSEPQPAKPATTVTAQPERRPKPKRRVAGRTPSPIAVAPVETLATPGARAEDKPAATEQQKADPPGRTEENSPPRGRTKQDKTPPGLAKKPGGRPPGQAKKSEEPPGQAKKAEEPRGQAKKAEEPRGQAKKAEEPRGQAKKPEAPIGQAKKAEQPAVQPEQSIEALDRAKEQVGVEPLGEARKKDK